MKITRYYNNRGGHGVSTVAAIAALNLARNDRRVLIAEIGEYPSVDAILGIPAVYEKQVVSVVPNVDLVWVRNNADLVSVKLSDYDEIVVDGGNHLGDAPNVLVTKACYLSLRQAAKEDKPQAVILAGEDNRALSARDIEHVLGARVVAVIPRDAHVARAIDAGLLTSRAFSLEALAELRDFVREGVAPVA